jgi:hypothetical protein
VCVCACVRVCECVFVLFIMHCLLLSTDTADCIFVSCVRARVCMYSNVCVRWNLQGKALYQLLDTTDGNLLVERFESICEWCEMCLRSEPSVIDIKPPCKVFGDIHGQLRDLLLLFREFGFPSNSRGDVVGVSILIPTQGRPSDSEHSQNYMCVNRRA